MAGSLAAISPMVEWGAVFLIGMALAILYLRYRFVRDERATLLKEKEVIYAYVHDVGEVFAETESVEVEPLLDRALVYALKATRASAGVVYLYDHGDEILRARAVSGGLCPPLTQDLPGELAGAASPSDVIERWIRERTFKNGEGLPGEVVAVGHSILIGDAEMDHRVPAHAQDMLHIRSLIGVPMRFHRRMMGAMFVMNPVDGHPFIASDMDVLQALADQASVSTHFGLLREELDAKRRLDHDLGVARRIQKTLLPRELPEITGTDIAAFSVPALQIGGDYYDVMQVDGDRWGMAIADVSGKGVSGALLMSVCRSVLRAQAPGCVRPSEVLNALCRVLAPDLGEDMFVTVLYMIYNIRTRELRISRAGHERPLWYHSETGQIEMIDVSGAAIGMVPPDIFEEVLGDVTVTLHPGDRITLYTDGISEAVNDHDEEWGIQRLSEALVSTSAGSAADALAHVQQRVMRFSSGTVQRDDMTMLCLAVK